MINLHPRLLKIWVDMEKGTVVGEGKGPFGDGPDEVEYQGHMGYSGPTLEHWYHTAMLVLWPKKLSISIASEAGISSALDLLESTLEISDANFREDLHQIVCYCENLASQAWKAGEAWQAGGDSSEDSVTPRLLNLCIRASVSEDVLQIFQLLAKTIQYKPRYSSSFQAFEVGVRDVEVAKAIANAVQGFGWGMFSSLIIDLVKECVLTQGESFALLAKQFICMGIEDAGAIVAKTTFEVFEARIAELKLHKMPEFTRHQPLAKLPDYPQIETFLKGPQAIYVHRGVKGLPAARSFGEKYFSKYGDHTATPGYSAVGIPGGQGRGASCTIQKTRRVYDVALQHWRKEREEI